MKAISGLCIRAGDLLSGLHMLKYTNIDILGNPILQRGYQKIVIENNGTLAGKVSVEVRKS